MRVHCVRQNVDAVCDVNNSENFYRQSFYWDKAYTTEIFIPPAEEELLTKYMDWLTGLKKNILRSLQREKKERLCSEKIQEFRFDCLIVKPRGKVTAGRRQTATNLKEIERKKCKCEADG